MCGIAIILEGSAVEVPPFAMERMTTALRHRGPDAETRVARPSCQLGHTRLCVIDPAGGRQPMADPTGRFWIVFNGEIYNFRELRIDLESRGHHFQTQSDTEVLLHAYIEFGGEKVLPRLNGQFAFAVWDDVEKTLFVARDRFGEKPLFWTRSPAGHVIFASEIKAILASEMISPRIDRASADAFVSLFYVPPDRTIYENVRAIPPAHAAIWENGRVRQWRYWEPRLSHLQIGEEEAVCEIRALLARAVKRQMVADVPVGAFLSGGLDSSTIVALMNDETPHAVRTFAAGFGDLINELPFAREVARQYATEHHELQMDIDVASMLSRMMEVYDEPFADSSNIPTYLIAEHARSHVKVVLSGDGGDEIFGGYDWYSALLSGAKPNQTDIWDRHLGAAADKAILRRDYRPSGDVTGIDRVSFFDISCYLPGDILVKVDRAAMAHGLETRAPFLDVDLAEFVLGLPWQMRFAGGRLKHLLRRACEDLWPESIRSRGKQGFGAPVRHWLRQPVVNEMWERISASGGALATLFPAMVKNLDTLRPQRQWTLLCLGLWLEKRSECLVNLSLAS